MAGFYLYCVRKKDPAAIKAVKTIDQGKLYIFPYKELEAVASEVDLKIFGSKEIQKKAEEDLNWIKEKAQIHEHVIEQAMEIEGRIVPVIPMKFGTIFKTKKSLKETLKENYARFRKAIEDLEGKQEWEVKVYLGEEVFEKRLEKELEKKDRNVVRKKEEVASLPKGADFFVKKQIEEIVKKAKIKKLKEVTDKIFEDLRNFAVEASKGKNLDKALTGRKEPMVLNLNLLIKEEKMTEFQKEVNGLKTKYQNQGLIIQESGPWPPYNFVS